MLYMNILQFVITVPVITVPHCLECLGDGNDQQEDDNIQLQFNKHDCRYSHGVQFF